MVARPLPLILLSSVLAAATGAIVALAAAPRSRAEVDTAAPVEPTPSSAALERMEARLDQLERTVTELRDGFPAVAGTRSEVLDLDAAFERWMQAHGPELASHVEPAAAESSGARRQRVMDAFAALSADGVTDVDAQRLWREFSQQGLGDEILAEFARRAELDPNNPDLKVELASAYFLKLAEVGNSPEAGELATKADKLLDAALALDGNHWEARFSKAVALSFWPPVFGKQKEAILHFEILVAQQATQPKRDEFAQTHLLLGNMYQQVGQTEQALAAWKLGLSQFPADEDLKKQLALYDAH